ncbi:hypothetical protein BGZ83_009460 [Gryganskiella cystojenkinii]|nr:hypothetical protein BGZ83_009460 [Gryganskiella cystojenkinii]
MQDRSVPIPACQRVFNLPELCNILRGYVSLQDLATLTLVSRAFHSLWTPYLWYSVELTQGQPSLPPLQKIEQCGHLVRTFRLENHSVLGQQQAAVLEKVRLHCHSLHTVELNFMEYGVSRVFLEQFLGIRDEALNEISQLYNGENSFIPGVTMLEFCRLRVGENNVNVLQQEQDPIWFRRLIPLSPNNGFLSNTIRSLEMEYDEEFLAILFAWISRAGWEGHLQGLVQFKLSATWGTSNPVKVEKELFFQLMESLPYLEEFRAPQIRVIANTLLRGQINADILDPTIAQPMSRILSDRRQRPLRVRKLTLWSLGLDVVDHNSSTPSSSPDKMDRDRDSQRPTPSILSRFPNLTGLSLLGESISDLAKALTDASQEQQHLERYQYHRTHHDVGHDPTNIAAADVQCIRHLTMRDKIESRVDSGWRTLFSSPNLQLETLDLSSRYSLPRDLLDHLVTSASVTSLKRVFFNLYDKGGVYDGISKPVDFLVQLGSVLRFLRSAVSLEEFICPKMEHFLAKELFTPEESAQWPCRDRLRSLKMHPWDLDLQGSKIDSAQMRRWVWSFGPSLKEILVIGRNATVDVLFDPDLLVESIAATAVVADSDPDFSSSSSCTSTCTPTVPEVVLPRPLMIKTLFLPSIQRSYVMTLSQTKLVFEQLYPRATFVVTPRITFKMAPCQFDDESLLWLEKERPEALSKVEPGFGGFGSRV